MSARVRRNLHDNFEFRRFRNRIFDGSRLSFRDKLRSIFKRGDDKLLF